jgi:hypothetical protein
MELALNGFDIIDAFARYVLSQESFIKMDSVLTTFLLYRRFF